ncbi:tRNA (adenosine(37)-N6)-threonylcarbamoyltransferase complex dimerization subunit type 1 TsaB [bacterium]|nr:tRNA (adenosine(37)-N6)-threonylcarbamoyltransferase complex dimerization subunit type 1 TsaB [bacterium]
MLNDLIAGLDCTGESFGVAVLRGGVCLAESGGFTPRSHLRLFFPALVECLQRHDYKVSDLGAIAVTVGPGSFTGVRLGVVTARTVAQAIGCKLVPVDALEALALNAPGIPEVMAGFDARRGEIFGAFFDTTGEFPRRLTPDMVLTPQECLDMMRERQCRAALGSAVTRYASVLGQCAGVSLLPDILAQIRGSHVARLGIKGLEEGHIVAPFALDPIYLRAAEVQVQSK